jgi:Holliday junction DNA helicase RuvA
MIARLRGILLEKSPPHLLIDVQGLAYELQASMFSFYRLPAVGQEVILHTHLVVREDAHLLYGFFEPKERALFRDLIRVSGVGPKVALAILSATEPDAFVSSIMQHNAQSLVCIPGIGKKTAERLIVEMRDRLSDWEMELGDLLSKTQVTQDQPTQEAISALMALGYKSNEARQAITQAAKEHQTSEAMIRHALQNISTR